MNILPLKLSNSEHNKKQVWNILPNLFHDPSAFNLLTSKLRLRLYVDQNHLDIDGTTFPRDKECVWSWSPTRTWHRRVSRPTTRLLSMKQKNAPSFEKKNKLTKCISGGCQWCQSKCNAKELKLKERLKTLANGTRDKSGFTILNWAKLLGNWWLRPSP